MSKVIHFSLPILLVIYVTKALGGKSLEEQKKQFDELGSLPLSTNPFFVKNIANSDEVNFEGNGTEGMEPDFLGYTCQWIGNLDCPDFSFQCSGSGIIDCTGKCPGDAETFDSMISMINNASLAEEFPLIAEIQKKSQNSTPEGKEKMLSMLRGCNVDGSFEKTISRMTGLFALADGFQSGLTAESSDDPNDVTFVDESALSGFGGDYEYDEYEYDDDYYADDEDQQDSTTIESKSRIIQEPNSELRQADLVIPGRKRSLTSEFESNEDNIIQEIPIKINARVPKDFQSKQGTIDNILTHKGQKRFPVIQELAKELAVLRRTFKWALSTLDFSENGDRKKRSNDNSKLKKFDPKLAFVLADQMKDLDEEFIRKIRSATNEMNMGKRKMMEEKCEVRNLTCVKFPTVKQCQGIGMGGCLSNSQIIKMLISPRMLMFVLMGIFAFVLCAGFLTYYIMYLRKSESNQVEPVNYPSAPPEENDSQQRPNKAGTTEPTRPLNPNVTSTP